MGVVAGKPGNRRLALLSGLFDPCHTAECGDGVKKEKDECVWNEWRGRGEGTRERGRELAVPGQTQSNPLLPGQNPASASDRTIM